MIAPREPLKDLSRLAAEIKGDVLRRWVAKAQKSAMLEWRDRRQFPGLMDRFTQEGGKARGFARRRYQKGGDPFTFTGSLRAMLAKRKPRTSYGAAVVTRLKYGGGALNFLSNKYGYMSVTVQERRTVEQVAGYSTNRKGTTINVASYTATRVKRDVIRTLAKRSYSEEFRAFFFDQQWITRKVDLELRRIYRSMAFDRRTGKIKVKVRLHPEAESEAA